MIVVHFRVLLSRQPNKSPEPMRVGAGSSASRLDGHEDHAKPATRRRHCLHFWRDEHKGQIDDADCQHWIYDQPANKSPDATAVGACCLFEKV